MSKDYYKILGVDKSASAEEIKKAFRAQAHKYHPDKAGGDEAKFKEVNEAYQILGNAEKRKQYDQFGTTFDQAGMGGGGNPFSGFGGFQGANINMDDFGDIFGDIFGGFGGRTRTKTRSKGADIHADMEIDIKESAFGVEKDVEFYKNITCGKCSGSGAEPGTKVDTCKTCGGNGHITKMQQTFLGAMQTQRVCPDCGGDGQIPHKKCSECSGRGIVKSQEKIKVKIPAGIDDGTTIKFAGKGEAGAHGAMPGDLYIAFHIKPNPEFERDGHNILSTEKISFKQAALGDKIEVNTLEGPIKLKIPSGTQSGTFFRLKGKGVPSLRGFGKGDQLVRVIVDIPKSLSRKQKKILEEWDE